MRTSRPGFAAAVVFVCLSLGPVLADTMTGAPSNAIVAVRSGSIVLKVPDYGEARSRIMQLAAARNAVLHEEKSEANFAGQRHGNVSLELDAAQLGPLMDEIRQVGKLYSEHVQTADQTSDYQKLEKRIALLRQNDSELQGFLHNSRRMRGSDILFVQYRLYESRVQAADAAQERSDIERRAKKGMLTVALFEPEPNKAFDWSNWRATSSLRAKSSLLYTVRKGVTGAFFALYFAWMWIPALLILFFGGRKLVRYSRRRMSEWTARSESEPPSL